MSQPVFASLLADRFMDFVTFRRSSGADYRGRAQVLSYFDRFLSQQGFSGSYPTREILDCYLTSLNRLHPNTRANRLSVVRQFCSYLRQFEPQCYVPEPGARHGPKLSRTPHIFTDDEIKALLVAAHHLSPPGSLRPMTFYTLFGLLYTTALRVGEAIALDLADVDLARQRLYVYRSKFRKSRWVPMSPSTCSVLQRYIQERTRIFPAAPQDPLFVNLQGRRFFLQIVYMAFRQALSRCGLRGGKGDPGPRIHDLRHSYACNRLAAAYRQGGDVNALLPALATYLGHVWCTCERRPSF
ncbi:MAG: tyrosine-type recombinase/integrase [Acidobacteria bacterium]|nr:tyrosine-type recombinase/integrase [Acidobacteriota bacterium]